MSESGTNTIGNFQLGKLTMQALATVQKNRGRIVQDGGIKALLLLIENHPKYGHLYDTNFCLELKYTLPLRTL